MFFWNELLTDSDSSSSEEEDGLRAQGIMGNVLIINKLI